MDIDGYTTIGVRIGRTHSTQHSDDVGVFLLDKVYNRTAHSVDESEVSGIDRHKYQANRAAETNATGLKGIRIECSNISNIYN